MDPPVSYLVYSTVDLSCIDSGICLIRYLRLSNDNHARPDVAKHGPFYALCQAVFYIIVFRHSQIMESGKGVILRYTCTLHVH